MNANVAFDQRDDRLADHVVADRPGDFLGQGLHPGPAGPRRQPVAPLLHGGQGGQEVEAQDQDDQGPEQAVRHRGAEADDAAEDAAHRLRVVDEFFEFLADPVPHAELAVEAAEEVGVDEVRIQRGACCTIWVTCWTIVGIRVAKKPATATASVETATRMPAARGTFLPSSQRTTGSRPRAMNRAATIQSRSWVVLEPIQYTSRATPTPTVPIKPTYRGCWRTSAGPGCRTSRSSRSPGWWCPAHAPAASRSGAAAARPGWAGAGGAPLSSGLRPRRPGASKRAPGLPIPWLRIPGWRLVLRGTNPCVHSLRLKPFISVYPLWIRGRGPDVTINANTISRLVSPRFAGSRACRSRP